MGVGVGLKVASWKVWRYRGVSQAHCRLSRHLVPYSFRMHPKGVLEKMCSCLVSAS